MRHSELTSAAKFTRDFRLLQKEGRLGATTKPRRTRVLLKTRGGNLEQFRNADLIPEDTDVMKEGIRQLIQDSFLQAPDGDLMYVVVTEHGKASLIV